MSADDCDDGVIVSEECHGGKGMRKVGSCVIVCGGERRRRNPLVGFTSNSINRKCGRRSVRPSSHDSIHPSIVFCFATVWSFWGRSWSSSQQASPLLPLPSPISDAFTPSIHPSLISSFSCPALFLSHVEQWRKKRMRRLKRKRRKSASFFFHHRTA